MWGISWLAENRLVSEEGLCSMEQVIKHFWIVPRYGRSAFCVLLYRSPSALFSQQYGRRLTTYKWYDLLLFFLICCQFLSCRERTELALRRLSMLLWEKLKKKAIKVSDSQLNQFYGCTARCLFSPVFFVCKGKLNKQRFYKQEHMNSWPHIRNCVPCRTKRGCCRDLLDRSLVVHSSVPVIFSSF
jgi:hypothetical protein